MNYVLQIDREQTIIYNLRLLIFGHQQQQQHNKREREKEKVNKYI